MTEYTDNMSIKDLVSACHVLDEELTRLNKDYEHQFRDVGSIISEEKMDKEFYDAIFKLKWCNKALDVYIFSNQSKKNLEYVIRSAERIYSLKP